MAGPVYYTDQVTRLPWRVFLKLVRPEGLSTVVAFLVLAFRKLSGRPFPPGHAVRRPESILFVEWDMIPQYARDAMEGAVAECEAAGMRLVCFTRGREIGGKESYNAILLSADGVVWANVTWLRIRAGELEKSQVLVAYHSDLHDGRILDTSACERISPRFRQLGVPQEHEPLYLPPDTSPAEVMRQHMERLASRGGAGPVAFDDATLLARLLDLAQRLHDHLVRQGLFVPISPAEADALRAATDSGAALPPPLPPHSTGKTQTDQKTGRRSALKTLGEGILSLGVLVFLYRTCRSRRGDPEENDKMCTHMLATTPHVEAKEWSANYKEVYFGNLDADETARMLEDMYKHNAGAIHLIEPHAEPDLNLSYTDTMIVKLPEDPAERKIFFDYEKKLMRWTGYSATGDIGQTYLFVWVD